MTRRQSYRDLATWLLAQVPRLGATRLVTVDGPAGSGKTSFADHLRATLGVGVVVHLDDLYEGWSGLDDALWNRLDNGVLVPIGAGRPGGYRRYDWDREQFAEWHEVAPEQVLIVEGVGAGQRGVDGRATLRVWVEAPEALRLQRGLDRDGVALREQWLRWLTVEAEHFAREETRARAELLVDGDAPSDSATSYSVVEDRRKTRADAAE